MGVASVQLFLLYLYIYLCLEPTTPHAGMRRGLVEGGPSRTPALACPGLESSSEDESSSSGESRTRGGEVVGSAALGVEVDLAG